MTKKLWDYADRASREVSKWPACRQRTLDTMPKKGIIECLKDMREDLDAMIAGGCRCRRPKPAPKTVAEVLDTMIAREAVLLERRRDRARADFSYAADPDMCPLVREQHGRVNALADLRTELLGFGVI